ncbi:MAG: hypothetical protein ABDH21_02335 [bacterium]
MTKLVIRSVLKNILFKYGLLAIFLCLMLIYLLQAQNLSDKSKVPKKRYSGKTWTSVIVGKVSDVFGNKLQRNIDNYDPYPDNGIIIKNLVNGYPFEESTEIIVEPRGKIYVAGTSYIDSQKSSSIPFIAKLNSNGSLDKTFGSNGIIKIPNLPNNIKVESTVSLINHKRQFYVGFYGSIPKGEYESENVSVIMKIDPNGKIQESFGDKGFVIIRNSILQDIIIDKKQSMYVGCSEFTIDANLNLFSTGLLYKLNLNGNKDTSFGSSGKIVISDLLPNKRNNMLIDISLGRNNCVYASVYVLPDVQTLTGDYMLILKATPKGLDKTFGQKGIFTLSKVGNYSRCSPTIIHVGIGEKLYVGGQAEKGQDQDIMVFKLNSYGQLDKTFGNNGISVIDIFDKQSEYKEQCSSITLDKRGNIYLFGNFFPSDQQQKSDCFAIRLLPTGKIDTSFSKRGVLVISNIGSASNRQDTLFSSYTDLLGRIFITGYTYNEYDSDIFVLKID